MAFIHPFTQSLINALSLLQNEGIVSRLEFQENEDHDYIRCIYKVEIPQYPVYDIRREEPVVFTASDSYPVPLPYFERDDFPSVPHLLRNTGGIKYPCLYQANFEQIALKWNAFEYASRVFIWLSRTSQGILHDQEQPLEDFVLTNDGQLFLPPKLPDQFSIAPIDEKSKTFQLKHHSPSSDNGYHVLLFDLGELRHMGIHSTPVTLLDIKNLIDPYQERLLENSLTEFRLTESFYSKRIFILLFMTITDDALNRSEKREYAFLVPEKYSEIGIKLGFLYEGESNEIKGQLILQDIGQSDLEKIPVISVSLHFPFTKKIGRLSNGFEENSSHHVVQIGLGAIGSQIARNCAQAGLAESWICIDNDTLLPHNLARWILQVANVGLPKAKIVSDALNSMFQDSGFSKYFVEKITFGNLPAIIESDLESASILVDSSASIPVQRTLDFCLKQSLIRFTIFLSPDGKSLVIFFTPSESTLSHSHLEMDFYQALAFDETLKNTLQETENSFTYGGDSCRALSFRMSTHQLSQFSGIASGIVEQWIKENEPKAGLWKAKEDFSIYRHKIPVTAWTTYKEIDDLNIQVSSRVIDTIRTQRTIALPNETGGILIGSYDVISRTMFIVDALCAPEDSTSTPVTFHRGMSRMEEELQEIKDRTHSNLYYIGEWHSHPDGAGTNMSKLDLQQLKWLRKESETKSYPLLMLICAGTEFNIFA